MMMAGINFVRIKEDRCCMARDYSIEEQPIHLAGGRNGFQMTDSMTIRELIAWAVSSLTLLAFRISNASEGVNVPRERASLLFRYSWKAEISSLEVIPLLQD